MKLVAYECPDCGEILFVREGVLKTIPQCYHPNALERATTASKMEYLGWVGLAR